MGLATSCLLITKALFLGSVHWGPGARETLPLTMSIIFFLVCKSNDMPEGQFLNMLNIFRALSREASLGVLNSTILPSRRKDLIRGAI